MPKASRWARTRAALSPAQRANAIAGESRLRPRPVSVWALRGAGGNIGIVTSLDIQAAEAGDIVYAVLV